MYRDTEQSYGDFTLDVYEGEGEWVVDWWKRSQADVCGQAKRQRRKDAVDMAKEQINKVISEHDL